MATIELDVLGEFLMEAVRDESVSDIRMIVSGRMKGGDAEGVRTKLKPLGARGLSPLEDAVPDLVDQVLHNLLAAIQQSSQV